VCADAGVWFAPSLIENCRGLPIGEGGPYITARARRIPGVSSPIERDRPKANWFRA